MAATGSAKSVLVLGGSGFVGRSLCRQLLASKDITNTNVRVISRDASRAAAVLPRAVEVIEGDILRDGPSLLSKHITPDVDAVVNCVGLLYETKSRGSTFEKAHVGLARALVQQAPKRLVYLSALGIDKAADTTTSEYAASKLAAERIYTEHYNNSSSGVLGILRPSIIYGPEDAFFNRFSSMTTWSPFLPLVGGGTTKYQPVHVDDVVRAIMKCVVGDTNINNDGVVIYELGGKDVVTFKQLMEMTLRACGKRRLLLNMPYALADMQGLALEKLHNNVAPRFPPLITRDQVKLLRIDNVVDNSNSNRYKGWTELGLKQEEIRGCGDQDIAYIKS